MKTIPLASTRFLKVVAVMIIMTVVSVPIAIGMSAVNPERSASEKSPAKDQSIMIALLLDTSNSMDGLIDQAKSQLWKIVNELAAAKCGDGSRPRIKIALYEYGNDGLPSSEGYIRQVSGLTNDLDLISEKLFALSTNGGNEFCGHVIQTSLNQLGWSTSAADLKMIFIAGNEPFTQGSVSYRLACSVAKEKGVVVNTIYCGEFDEGLNTNWKDGADRTGGSYMSIEQNRKTVFIATPYDSKIAECNDRLNKTYLYYGTSGREKKEAQAAQDKNAESYGQANKVERAVSKSTHAYQNSSWDLVDAAKDDESVITTAPAQQLPEEMQGMSAGERKVYVAKKADERKAVQNEILELNKKRQQYLAAHQPAEDEGSMLDVTMIKAIREKAKDKGLEWK
ncbi:MAG TPA: vWA domain-containing protein [Cyclobacteriaceae bacterium]|nr:vWA domain-containing protein [Cyclobacteriaceae bacterium]